LRYDAWKHKEEAMAVSERLRAFLASSKIRYTVARHPVAYTAQEIAAAQHVPGRQLAKSVLVKTDRGGVLAVLPAVHLIDLKKLKTVLGAKQLTIAKEADVKQQFPDIEVGAMSPFGNLYGVPVVVDRGLGEAEEIVFNGGSHTETIKLRYRDFASLVTPKSGAFALPLSRPAAAKRKLARKKAAKPRRARPRKKSSR
jgi:Ala-tRNA(Pro) deacylase